MSTERTPQIDRTAYEPAYAQLLRILEGQIAAGTYRPGDQLPSEAQLCAQYGISPMTVRRVINLLVDHGLAVAYQGRGTFVRGPDLSAAVFQLTALKQLLTQNEHVHVQLLETRVVRAEGRIARKLNVTPDQSAVYLRRLLFDQDTPIIYHREYLVYDPTRPIVEGELEATSLDGLFHNTGGTVLKGGHVTIEAVTLREEEARLLQTVLGGAAFCLEHIFYDVHDHPMSWGWFIWRGDRCKFTAELGARIHT